MRVESQFSILVTHANHHRRRRGELCSLSGAIYRRPRAKGDEDEMVELSILVRAVWCGFRYRVWWNRWDVLGMAVCVFWQRAFAGAAICVLCDERTH